MSLLDQAGEIRQGEELDARAVDQYLKSVLPQLQGEPSIRQFPSGASNLTYLIRYPDQDLILRRPPFGHKDKTAHDMGREYRVLTGLKAVYPYVPEALHYCEDESVMGCPFYVMQRLQGIILRKDFPEGFQLNPEQTRQLCEQAIDKLVQLHQVDYQQAGLSDLGKPEGYVERQIKGWNRRMQAVMTDDAPDFSEVVGWLEAKMPAETKGCVIHNDYRFDNLVLNPDNPLEIIGVLDWEMCTLGDPLMDLGNTISYWIQADDDDALQLTRLQPTHMPGMMTRQEVLDYYARQTGMEINNFDFYSVYGNFRLAVVMQQMYYRFRRGQTKDERFGMMAPLIELFHNICRQQIEKSSL